MEKFEKSLEIFEAPGTIAVVGRVEKLRRLPDVDVDVDVVAIDARPRPSVRHTMPKYVLQIVTIIYVFLLAIVVITLYHVNVVTNHGAQSVVKP